MSIIQYAQNRIGTFDDVEFLLKINNIDHHRRDIGFDDDCIGRQFAFLLVDESIIKIGGSESILKMRFLLIRISSSASVLFFVTQQHKVEDVKRY